MAAKKSTKAEYNFDQKIEIKPTFNDLMNNWNNYLYHQYHAHNAYRQQQEPVTPLTASVQNSPWHTPNPPQAFYSVNVPFGNVTIKDVIAGISFKTNSINKRKVLNTQFPENSIIYKILYYSPRSLIDKGWKTGDINYISDSDIVKCFKKLETEAIVNVENWIYECEEYGKLISYFYYCVKREYAKRYLNVLVSPDAFEFELQYPIIKEYVAKCLTLYMDEYFDKLKYSVKE